MKVTASESIIVNESKEVVWDKSISPQQIEKVLPNVSGVRKTSDSVYLVKLDIGIFGIASRQTRVNVEENRPEHLDLYISDPKSLIEIDLNEISNNRTKIDIHTRITLPGRLRLMKSRIESRLSSRVRGILQRIKSKVE